MLIGLIGLSLVTITHCHYVTYSMTWFISYGFIQLVDTPPRQNNILDIFATNRPSLVIKCGTVSGISDH